MPPRKKYERKRLDGCVGSCEFRTGCSHCDNKIKQRTERNPKRRATEEDRLADNQYQLQRYHATKNERVKSQASGDSSGSSRSAPAFPPVVSESKIMDVVHEAGSLLEVGVFEKKICYSCLRLVRCSSLLNIAMDDLSEDMRQVITDYQLATDDIRVCVECGKHQQDRFQSAPHSVLNGLHFGVIPEELQELSLLEEMLISRIRCRFIICKLRGERISNPVLCQSAIKGNVIAFPQNVEDIHRAICLPHSPDTVPQMLKIILCGSFTQERKREAIRKYGVVRRDKVLAALRWKIANDSTYMQVSISLENLSSYVDGEVPHQLLTTASEIEDYGVNGDQIGTVVGDEELVNVSGESVGYVDFTGTSISNTELESLGIDNAVLKVPHSRTPYSEYENDYWPGVFPTLFPYGRGLPNDTRNIALSFRDWLKYCLHFHDRRFRIHPVFLFIAYNILKRRQICASAKVRCKGNNAERLRRILSELDPAQLQTMSDSIRSHPNLSFSQAGVDRNVFELLRQIQVVGAPVIGSVQSKLHRRNELRSIIVKCGLPTLWLTINPADLKTPAVAMCSGFTKDIAMNMSSFERLRLVANDPVATAEFFDYMICTVIENVIEAGAFGPHASHFGMVETQGRGGLHVHMLIWIDGSLSPEIVASRMANDPFFENAMISYKDSVITEFLSHVQQDESAITGRYTSISEMKLSSFDDLVRLSSSIASSNNLHRAQHTSSCFKGSRSECRFGFPRKLNELRSRYDAQSASIVSKRNHPWLNPFNRILALLCQCNHDIQMLSTSSDCLALTYYITEYATKRELKSYEILSLVSAAILKWRGSEHEADPNASDSSKRALIKCINSIGTTKEVPGSMCAFDIFYDKESYTNQSFTRVNWKAIESWYLAFCSAGALGETFEDDVHFDLHQASSNLRMDYMYRGEELAGLNLYTYASVIYRVPHRNGQRLPTQGTYFSYIFPHPQVASHFQKLRFPFRDACVVLIGPSFPDSHEMKESYQRCVLLLFKPWSISNPLISHNSCLQTEFDNFMLSLDESSGNPFHSKYSIPTVSRLIENIKLLKKCKDAGQLNAKQRREQLEAALSVLDTHSGDLAHDFTEYDDEPEIVDEELPFFEMASLSLREDETTRQHIFNVRGFDSFTMYSCRREGSVQTDSEFSQFPEQNARITMWDSFMGSFKDELSIKAALSDIHTSMFKNTIDNYGVDKEALASLLPDTIINMVVSKRTLNVEQERAVRVVASHLIGQHQNQQLLMYLAGAAGTGKSEVIASLEDMFSLLSMQSKLRLSASTGTAASRFFGSTIHSLCKISVRKNQEEPGKLNPKLKILHWFWSDVEYLVIDEVSMISAQLLADICSQLQKAKSSEQAFGGVNVILAGDFYQFPPVTGTPLFKSVEDFDTATTAHTEKAVRGLSLFSQFESVVTLKTNYRQRLDSRYQQILGRHLEGTMTQEDIELLKTRILSRTNIPPADAVVILNRNDLRVAINSQEVSEIARTNRKKVWNLVAKDSSSVVDISSPEAKEYLLNIPDHHSEGLPGKLKLFKGMRVMVTHNVGTAHGLSNGSMVSIYHVPEFPEGELPRYVLVRIDKALKSPFPGLPSDVVPVKPISATFQVKQRRQRREKLSITRTQFPLVPSYAITDYKSQGCGFTHVVVDLRYPPTGKWNFYHAVYVILSRVTTLQGLFILCDFDEKIFRSKPPEVLQRFIARLRELDEQTIARYG